MAVTEGHGRLVSLTTMHRHLLAVLCRFQTSHAWYEVISLFRVPCLIRDTPWHLQTGLHKVQFNGVL